MTIEITGAFYTDLHNALQVILEQAGRAKGEGTLKDGLVSYRFRVDGETFAIPMYHEAALDQCCPWGHTTQQRFDLLQEWYQAFPQQKGRIDPDSANELRLWLRQKFPKTS